VAHIYCIKTLWASLRNCEKRLLSLSCLSVYLSVCPSVRIAGRTHVTNWRICIKFEIEYFSKICQENSLKSNKNNGHETCRPMYIYDNISLNKMFKEKSLKKKPKTRILYSLKFLLRILLFMRWYVKIWYSRHAHCVLDN